MTGAADIGRNDMAKSNKVAIVTGSATGLGASCALDLAERGWNVAINYTKSRKEADETYEAVKAKGVEAILVQADMGQDADCRKLAEETILATCSQKNEHVFFEKHDFSLDSEFCFKNGSPGQTFLPI